ncbi:MAG: aminotransferase class V-fold PLP-dependent enzyme [Clostridia bacterium]|nr:aminotransferase class V-fold PLP-dependent enzyme [Clostridia bacterium]
MIYFDCAASSLQKPPSVYDAHITAMRAFSCGVGRSGYAPALRAAEKIYEVRERAAEFFGMPKPCGAVITHNATHALNTALKGTILPGERLVISDMEHNAVYRTAMWLKNCGVKIDIVHIAFSDDETCENFRAAFSKETRAVCITHISNVFGNILPIRRIFEDAKKHGILTILDASQSAGSIKINMEDDNIDILCCAGHKGLMGPQGTGLMCVNSDVDINPVIHGGTGSDSVSPDMPKYLPDRFEAGTHDTPGIIALGEGMGFIENLGVEKIFEHEKSIISFIKTELSKLPNVTIYERAQNTAGLFSFNIEGIDSEETAARLDALEICVRSGLHCSPLAHKSSGTLECGTVRVSAGIYNTFEEAERLIWAVRSIA